MPRSVSPEQLAANRVNASQSTAPRTPDGQARNHNYLLANGFHRLVRQTGSFALRLRYQAQAERQYRRAIEEFERLKSLREELKNEPNSPPKTRLASRPLPTPRPPAPRSRPRAPGPGTSFAPPVWSNLYHEG